VDARGVSGFVLLIFALSDEVVQHSFSAVAPCQVFGPQRRVFSRNSLHAVITVTLRQSVHTFRCFFRVQTAVKRRERIVYATPFQGSLLGRRRSHRTPWLGYLEVLSAHETKPCAADALAAQQRRGRAERARVSIFGRRAEIPILPIFDLAPPSRPLTKPSFLSKTRLTDEGWSTKSTPGSPSSPIANNSQKPT
jgi:hypothetical protein